MITVRNQDDTLLKPIPYAGLILLHPFLMPFFKNIGVLNDNEFNISSEKFNLSFHSLYYLATGKTVSNNDNTLFIKWFLTIPDDFNISLNFELDENVIYEADMLLNSVINQWASLNNVSKEGLRELYLQRRAIVNIEENTINLLFDTMTFDIIINTLPWNISLFRVDWNAIIITSNW